MSLRMPVKYIINKLPTRLRCLIQSLCLSGRMQVGRGTFVYPTVHLLGKRNIRIGSNTCVSEGGWLNVNHRETGKVSIEIGNNCFIGKHNFFTSGDVISIGDYTLTTIGCKFIGSTHNVSDPNVPYLITGTSCSDKIEIGANCFVGAGSTVLGNVKVGHGSVIGAESLVLRDIPPFSMAIGNPARVVKRYSFIQKTWLPASEITQEDELAMPNEMEYLAMLSASHPRLAMPWIAAGKGMGDL